MAQLTLAIRRIDQSWDRYGAGGSMIRGAEFPRIGEEDSNHIPGLYSGGDESACKVFNNLRIFGKGNAPFRLAGCINDSGELTKTLASAGYEIVNEDSAGIGV